MARECCRGGGVRWHRLGGGQLEPPPRIGHGISPETHGGMWGDLVLLPIANAAIVPFLSFGPWIVPAATRRDTRFDRRAHPLGRARQRPSIGRSHVAGPRSRIVVERVDLSWAGWAHVIYVTGELTLLLRFSPPCHAGTGVILLGAAVFTLHLPLGLLQPRYFLTGHMATVSEQPLLLRCVGLLGIVAVAKLCALL